MTAVDVDALAKLREAATPGPWQADDYEVTASRHRFVAETGWRPDAALIVGAVNALPDLLAEVQKLRALRDAVEGLAVELAEETASRKRVAGATPCCDAADRLRATVEAALGGEQ